MQPERNTLASIVDSNNNATPESLIAAKIIDSAFSLLTIEPIVIRANMAAVFAAYSVNILYFALSMHIVGRALISAGPAAYVAFHDNANAETMRATNMGLAYDVVGSAFNHIPNEFEIKNVLFSRVTTIDYADCQFIGYKLTL